MATKRKSTALDWIIKEAKSLKKKYPKRFDTWKEYISQASAIYASKHGGKSPVGKKRKVGSTKKKAVKAKVGDPVYNAYKKAPLAVKKIIDTLDFQESYTKLSNAAKKLKKLGWEMDYDLDGSITKLTKMKKTSKKVGAKAKAKKAPVRSTHKDTKSHNVNIRVVSGFDDSDLMDRINRLIKFNKEIEKYILDLNHRIKTDKSDTFVLLQKSRAMAAVKRYKDLLADNKKYLASLKKHIK